MSKLKEQHHDEVIRLYYTEGYSEESIGQMLGIGHTTVGRWVLAYAESKGKTKAVLREEMGGSNKRNGRVVKKSQDTMMNKELQLLYRKLKKARLQVITIEMMIRTIEEGTKMGELLTIESK